MDNRSVQINSRHVYNIIQEDYYWRLVMCMVEKSVHLTDQQDKWIKAQLRDGHYEDASEIIRELIQERRLQDQETNQFVANVRDKLLQAEHNGFTDQAPIEILGEIKNGLGREAI